MTEIKFAAGKIAPQQALDLLLAGNKRFCSGTVEHPNTDCARLILAASEDQRDHAFATILTCSDSRVPVERIFDAGIMDIFVIRVAGNVVGGNEAASIEYGLNYVHTPVLLVLGHTQCGAVRAATDIHMNQADFDGENILNLVERISPAVEAVMAASDQVLVSAECYEQCIIENIWNSIECLLRRSPSTRKLIAGGHVLLAGAVYDVGSGAVEVLGQQRVQQILAKYNHK